MKKISNISITLGLAGALAGAGILTSCGDDKILTTDFEEVRLVSDIEFKVSDILPLAVGQDSTLVFTVGPETADDLSIVFKSSDENVATVAPDGTISAVSLGQAIIPATPPIGFGAEASVIVEVIPEIIKATDIIITNTTDLGEDGVIYVTDEIQLAAEILPENHTYSNITWHSSDESIATVDENGLVKCLGAGKVDIIVLAHDKGTARGSIELEIKPYIAAESLTITPLSEPICITRGPVALNVQYQPAGATLGSVEWTSSDETIATVHRGVVTPVGFGTVTITGKCMESGATYETSVTVEPGWYIYDAQNQWTRWSPSNTSTQIESEVRGEKVWRLNFKNPGSAGKWRGDFKVDCSNANPFVMSLKNYPVFAVRMTKMNGGNSTLDCVFDGYGNAGNPNPKNGIDLGDGTQLLVYDLGAAKNYSGVDIANFRVFQVKLADIPYANVDPDKAYYEIYWLRTFKSAEDAEAFARAEVASGN